MTEQLGPEQLRMARGELIGLALEVLESTDPTLVGVVGTVVDETLGTLRIRRPDRSEVTVAKTPCVFAFGTERVRIPGARIRYRPEDRTKKVR